MTRAMRPQETGVRNKHTPLIFQAPSSQPGIEGGHFPRFPLAASAELPKLGEHRG